MVFKYDWGPRWEVLEGQRVHKVSTQRVLVEILHRPNISEVLGPGKKWCSNVTGGLGGKCWKAIKC